MSFFDEGLDTDEFDDEQGKPIPHDLRYVREKLLLACLSMSTDDRGVRQRLAGAWLNYSTLEVSDFPADLRQDFLRIRDAVPQGQLFTAGLAQLTDEQVYQIIRQIIWLNDAVSAREGQSLQGRTAFGTR